MSRAALDGLRIAVLTADGFEQIEVTRPVKALESQGAEVDIVSLRPGSIQGMNMLYPGDRLDVDRTLLTARAADYDGLHIPGGFIAPDFVRQSERALDFVRAFDAAGKPIATICHGPWVLASAGLVEGRRLTSWPGIKDDLLNAGADWTDEAVVRDGNWVSSRGPHDLRAFDKAIVAHFAGRTGRAVPDVAVGEWGSWIVGTAAVAAAGYAVRRAMGESGPVRRWADRRATDVDDSEAFNGSL